MSDNCNKPSITEVNFTPVRPDKGLVGFASFVINGQIYLGGIAVFTRLNPGQSSVYRLAYPEDNIRKKSFFHPINRSTQVAIETAVSRYIEELLSRDENGGSRV